MSAVTNRYRVGVGQRLTFLLLFDLGLIKRGLRLLFAFKLRCESLAGLVRVDYTD